MRVRIGFKPLVCVLLAALIMAAAAIGVLPGRFSVYADSKTDSETDSKTDNKTDSKTGSKRPTVLLILDGYGLNERSEHNAIALADTPVMDRLLR